MASKKAEAVEKAAELVDVVVVCTSYTEAEAGKVLSLEPSEADKLIQRGIVTLK